MFLSLLRSSGFVVGLRVSGAIFGILTQFLLARFLGADEVGLFFVVLGLASILSIICTLGYPMLVPRIAAEASVETDSSKLSSFMLQAWLDSGVMCLFLIFLMMIIAWIVFSNSVSFHMIMVFAALNLPGFVLLRLNGALANALKYFDLGFLPDIFVRPFLLLAVVLVLSISISQMSIEIILFVHAVTAIILAFVQFFLLRDRTDLQVFSIKARAGSNKKLRQDWRHRAPPMIIIALFTNVFADLDIVITRLYLNDAETGIFGVCLKISLFIGFAIQVIYQLILRDTADALHIGDDKELQMVINRANFLTLLSSVIATIIILVFGKELLGFFGAPFQIGYESLVLLMFAQVVRAAMGPASQILTLTGHERSCWPVFLSCMVLLFVGNLVLIPWIGLAGAALTVVIVYAMWSIWMALLVREKLGVTTSFFLPATRPSM